MDVVDKSLGLLDIHLSNATTVYRNSRKCSNVQAETDDQVQLSDVVGLDNNNIELHNSSASAKQRVSFHPAVATFGQRAPDYRDSMPFDCSPFSRRPSELDYTTDEQFAAVGDISGQYYTSSGCCLTTASFATDLAIHNEPFRQHPLDYPYCLDGHSQAAVDEMWSVCPSWTSSFGDQMTAMKSPASELDTSDFSDGFYEPERATTFLNLGTCSPTSNWNCGNVEAVDGYKVDETGYRLSCLQEGVQQWSSESSEDEYQFNYSSDNIDDDFLLPEPDNESPIPQRPDRPECVPKIDLSWTTEDEENKPTRTNAPGPRIGRKRYEMLLPNELNYSNEITRKQVRDLKSTKFAASVFPGHAKDLRDMKELSQWHRTAQLEQQTKGERLMFVQRLPSSDLQCLGGVHCDVHRSTFIDPAAYQQSSTSSHTTSKRSTASREANCQSRKRKYISPKTPQSRRRKPRVSKSPNVSAKRQHDQNSTSLKTRSTIVFQAEPVVSSTNFLSKSTGQVRIDSIPLPRRSRRKDASRYLEEKADRPSVLECEVFQVSSRTRCGFANNEPVVATSDDKKELNNVPSTEDTISYLNCLFACVSDEITVDEEDGKQETEISPTTGHDVRGLKSAEVDANNLEIIYRAQTAGDSGQHSASTVERSEDAFLTPGLRSINVFDDEMEQEKRGVMKQNSNISDDDDDIKHSFSDTRAQLMTSSGEITGNKDRKEISEQTLQESVERHDRDNCSIGCNSMDAFPLPSTRSLDGSRYNAVENHRRNGSQRSATNSRNVSLTERLSCTLRCVCCQLRLTFYCLRRRHLPVDQLSNVVAADTRL